MYNFILDRTVPSEVAYVELIRTAYRISSSGVVQKGTFAYRAPSVLRFIKRISGGAFVWCCMVYFIHGLPHRIRSSKGGSERYFCLSGMLGLDSGIWVV